MSRPVKYVVSLSDSERELLKHKKRSKKCTPTIRKRIQIILLLDQNGPDHLSRDECVKKTKACKATVINAASLYVREGLEGLLTIKRNPNSNSTMQKFDGEDEAKILAMACMEAPDGREKWTIRMLTAAAVIVLERSISPSTVQRILKNNDLKPHMSEYWCIPEENSAAFVCAMEDTLDIYQRPEDPAHPVWCIDEKPYQIRGNTRNPLPVKPGSVKKIDAEFERIGKASIFCMINPNTGEIHQAVRETRTAVDFAHQIRWIVDEAEPDAEKVIIVMDNLNTHKIDSLYKAFSPEEASRIRNKVEFHYTPLHGSWLDIAEIGINIISTQCLGQRFQSMEQLRETLNIWEAHRNKQRVKIDWKFTSKDARTKLKHLYPIIEV